MEVMFKNPIQCETLVPDLEGESKFEADGGRSYTEGEP